MSKVTLVAVLVLAASCALAGEAAVPPAFKTKPTTTRAGDKVRIEFAVQCETDVAVYIEDVQGKIVRHLVAGVLGKNPPEPLKANSLEQPIVWNGKDDDGKVAEGGPFKVRVGLGLKPSWGGTAFAEKGKDGPNNITFVGDLAVAPEPSLSSAKVAKTTTDDKPSQFRNSEATGFAVVDSSAQMLPEGPIMLVPLRVRAKTHLDLSGESNDPRGNRHRQARLRRPGPARHVPFARRAGLLSAAHGGFLLKP